MSNPISRRSFLRTSTLASSTLLILPSGRLAFGSQANSRLNIAGIGVGGQGRGNLDNFIGLGENIVALCDVDTARAGDIFKKCSSARVFKDFRRMFDEMDKQIDAVLVATPDHTHAIAAVAAMKRG